MLFENEMPQDGYLLIGSRDFEEFSPRHESDYTFENIYQSKKRGCDIGDIVNLYKFSKK